MTQVRLLTQHVGSLTCSSHGAEPFSQPAEIWGGGGLLVAHGGAGKAGKHLLLQHNHP